MTTLSELLRLQDEATPGPWMPGEPYQTDDGTLELAVYADHPLNPKLRVYPLVVCLQFPNAEKMQVANREFVMAARNFDFRQIAEVVSIATELMELCDRNHVVQEELPIRNRLRAALASLDTKARGDDK